MRALIKRFYYFVKGLPVIGPVARRVAVAFRSRQEAYRRNHYDRKPSDPKSRAMRKNEELASQLDIVADRIALLEQMEPAILNYIASWADTVLLIRREQEELKKRLEYLSTRMANYEIQNDLRDNDEDKVGK